MTSPRVTVGIPTYDRPHLLRESVESVLSQSFTDFRLLISDNASEEETRNVVDAFNDDRIEYSRSDINLGMIGNFNRIINLSRTEFLTILPDDDILYPQYLSSVLDVIERLSNVGLVHTAFDLIDASSQVLVPAMNLMKGSQPLTLESGEQYLDRTMTSVWPICFSSAIYRRRALVETGGFRADEQPFADLPLWMRMALNWDFAFLARPLAAYRDHPDTASMSIGSEADSDIYGRGRTLLYAQSRLDRRIGFIDSARISDGRATRYRSLATLAFLVESSGLGTSWVANTTGLLSAVRSYPRVLLHRAAWRFVAAQLGGRHVRRTLTRLVARGHQAS